MLEKTLRERNEPPLNGPVNPAGIGRQHAFEERRSQRNLSARLEKRGHLIEHVVRRRQSTPITGRSLKDSSRGCAARIPLDQQGKNPLVSTNNSPAITDPIDVSIRQRFGALAG